MYYSEFNLYKLTMENVTLVYEKFIGLMHIILILAWRDINFLSKGELVAHQ